MCNLENDETKGRNEGSGARTSGWGKDFEEFGCTQVELRSSHRYEVLVGNWKCMARVGRDVSART